MKIVSNYATPNFQARVKLKAPNMQKIKQASVKSMNNPETKKALASLGVSLAGTASVALGYSVEPDNLPNSVQSVEKSQMGTASLGTTVSEIPVLASVVGSSNELSGTNSSASVEGFLFDKFARKRSINVSKHNLKSLNEPQVKKNMLPYSAVTTAAGIEFSGVAPAGSVESLVSGADVAEVQAASQVAGMISLAPPASSAFASAFKELESAEASNSLFNNTSKKSANDKKLPS